VTPDEFRSFGYQLIDWIADYRAGIRDERVWSDAKPGSLLGRLPAQAPLEAESPQALLRDLETLIKPHLSHWQHPMFYGYFPANSSLEAVLGDLVSSGLGQLGLNWQSSPALTELEQRMTEWMRDLCAMPADFQGVIQDTASSSSLLALMTARERCTNYASSRGGLQAEEQSLTVYVSSQSHSSVEKGALLAGFGRDHLRVVPVDNRFDLNPEALEAMIQADLERGAKPCCIVATVGSTATTACDPLEPIAAIAARFGVWLHVDAAMAGSAMILPECHGLFAGLEGADSVALNPHKWLGATFDCSLYYVRDAEHLVRVMSTNPSYLQTSTDGSVRQYRDWGVPLGRRMRALKLWFLLRLEGVERLRDRLRRDLENARWLETQLLGEMDWRVLNPVRLQTLCVRHEPAGMSAEALDAHTLAWVNHINSSGGAYLTPAMLDGRWMARVSIGALETTRDDVAALWALMRDAVKSVSE
jgi:aromatic-L-amino-acid/L-tryptophan decarboxylase